MKKLILVSMFLLSCADNNYCWVAEVEKEVCSDRTQFGVPICKTIYSYEKECKE